MNVLVCTLGVSWQVVPEVFSFLAPRQLDLFREHPRSAEIEALRATHGLLPPDEIWVCTTEGKQTSASLEQLDRWWSLVGAPVPLRTWRAAGTNQLATQRECSDLRELTFRLILYASELVGREGQLVLSLAGGRKTMSADMQTAGGLFGARAWLHVVGPEPLPEALARGAQPATFAAPLPAELAGAIMPLVVGRGSRDELLDIELDGRCVTTSAFPVPLAAPRCSWALPAGAALVTEIERRQQQGSRLLGNFLAHLGATERMETWRSLYRLPPARIAALRSTPVTNRDQSWLDALPKADLHRHLGGCLDLAAQREVGRAIWGALSDTERGAALDRVRPLLESASRWNWQWPNALRTGNRAANAAALLVEASDATLVDNLFRATEPRVALKSGRGFEAYERPGELTGSAVLGHPAAIEPYASAAVAAMRREGLYYLELRGSPQKYRPEDPVGFCADLRTALLRCGANEAGGPTIRFIWIVDRRQVDTLEATIRTAAEARDSLGNFLVGLDVAGDEDVMPPEELAPLFTPAFRECLSITIHAGEGESAENIWQAAYHLHADRIGHGLSLQQNPRLRERFLDRRICLELCPTSNREVVGFADPDVIETAGMAGYPLRAFLDHGLPVTICTDNPGISRTTLGGEYITAARMLAGNLTHWEALGVMHQAFVHAFAETRERERLLREGDATVFRVLTEGVPEVDGDQTHRANGSGP